MSTIYPVSYSIPPFPPFPPFSPFSPFSPRSTGALTTYPKDPITCLPCPTFSSFGGLPGALSSGTLSALLRRLSSLLDTGVTVATTTDIALAGFPGGFHVLLPPFKLMYSYRFSFVLLVSCCLVLAVPGCFRRGPM